MTLLTIGFPTQRQPAATIGFTRLDCASQAANGGRTYACVARNDGFLVVKYIICKRFGEVLSAWNDMTSK